MKFAIRTHTGKTSVLLSALGETRVTRGHVRVRGSIAFVPQFPWVQAGTVRNCILFGLPYDEERYKQTIHACALERDLQIMPNGDMTLISERGTYTTVLLFSVFPRGSLI